MNLLAALGLGAILFLPVIASEPEIVFRGTRIEITKPFVCGGKMPEGRYDLVVATGESGSPDPVLKVSKGDKTLCEVKGSPGRAYDAMNTGKVRVFLRVNSEAKAIQIDLVVPVELQSKIPNQAFLLPLAPGH